MAGIIGIPGRLQLEWVAAFARNPRPISSECARYPTERVGERELTTTFYHFGYDDRTRRICGFAYRSADEFRSEPLPTGFSFKPAPEWAIDSAKIRKLPEHFVALAKRQKTQDEATEPAKRVVIGGQLVFSLMQCIPGPRNKRIVQTSTAICHSFPDFEAMYAQAAAKISAT